MTTLPIENYLAACPPVRTVRMGWLRRPVVLRPLTMYKCVMLDALGVDPCREVTIEDTATVAWVLSEEVEKHSLNSLNFSTFSRRVQGRLHELCKAVNATMQDAFATYVKPQPSKGPSKMTPSGIGWWLSHAEGLCGDYGWTWRQALDTPLATVFALEVAKRERYGVDNGAPDYVERAYIKEHFKHG